MTMTLSGDGTITGLVAGGLPDATITTDELAAGAALNNAPNSVGFRNRIINGDMRIDQRNAGASVTPTTNSYTLDRWIGNNAAASKLTVQQSSTAPTGFSNSLLVTSSSAYSPSASEPFYVSQRVEGFNWADLGWGSANAKTVTLSFWVRSSLTGTFSGSFQNSATDYSYPYTYTISSANTWEYKTVTVAGPTSGTWIGATNGIGLRLYFSMGAGSTYQGTAGAWASTDYRAATGEVAVVGTNGATWYITGVQLEVGSVATPFERRPYGTELALCQRYYEKSYNIDVVPGAVTYTGVFTNGGFTNMAAANYATRASTIYKVTKRATPTVTTYDTAGNAGKCNYPDTSTNQSFTVIHNAFTTFSAETSTLSNGTDTRCYWHFTSSAEL